jgi:tyrosine-protein phosphatase SIW14
MKRITAQSAVLKTVLRMPLLVALLMILLIVAYSSDGIAQSTIPEFHQVTEHIYRGGRPDEAGLKDLAALGIKTILNLEDNKQAIEGESATAKQLGINEISMPMSGFFRPKRAEVEAILKIMNDPANQPLFVHCQHGQDRTGVIIGLYRVSFENWTPANAYTEMLQNGFHRILFLLDGFYEDMTGFED